MESKKPSLTDAVSGPATSASKPTVFRRWGEERVSSAAELFEKLDQQKGVSQLVHPHDQRSLSSSEFLEVLRKQEAPEGQSRSPQAMAADGNFHGSSSKGQSMHNKYRNQDFQSAAIDQCDITSSVDYGCRDYYNPSTNSSEKPSTYNENESDEGHTACIDARGNWWQGSFYY